MKSCNFELDGEALRVKRPKVEGLLYHEASGLAMAPSRGVLRDAGGSQFHVARLKVDGDRLQLRTAGGLEVAIALDRVARIDFSQGNMQYLGELKPESAVWTPTLATRTLRRPRVLSSSRASTVRSTAARCS